MSDNPQKCAYYLRIIRFLVEIGTETVRNLFYHFKPKHDVQTFFICGTICDELLALKRRHALSLEQYRQLTFNPNPDEFDLSLLITLLTNIFTGMIDPPVNGWNKPIDQFDISTGADLLRLKHIRNAIVGHSVTARLSLHEFNDFWKQIEDIMIRFDLLIDVRNKDAFRTKIDEYKHGKLDLEDEQERKYTLQIQKWYEEGQEKLSDLRNEVEDMVKKSQEFFFYFKNKPKRYVQYIKLLFEGGRMVLIDILHQELEKQALSLTDVLLGSRESLLAKDEAALSEIYMQSSSSETRINTDTSTWDIQSLAMVISYICNTNENQVIVNEVDIISNARKDFAEAAFLSLNIEKFSICREDLVSSIKTLSSLAGAETYKKCNALLEKYRKEMDTDLNNNDNPYLDQLTTHGMNVKTLSEVYTEVLGKLNIALNKMAADNHVFQQDQVLELKMVTLGRTKEKTEIAENILTTVWEAAIKMSDTPNDFVEVRKKVDVILEHIRAIPDVDTIKVENHCILLSMSCRSCYGLTQLLEYMESDSLKRHLASVSLEIGFVCNDTFCITGNITFESLYQLTTVIDRTEKEADLNESNDDEDDSSSLDSDYENVEAETEAISAHKAAPLKLRRYQLELAENAILGRNTIICAETGSGKTWVALHIVQKHLQEAGNGPRKVVFMARTGALIKQQSDRFKAYLPEFHTKLITGEDDSSRMLNMFIDDYDILCFTPQILVNNLEDNVIKSLSEFSLLILDECHHTRGDGPYSTLMRKYLIEKAQTTKEMPQVVGLTASIGVGKSRTDMEAVEYILRVCACLDVRLLSTVVRNLTELKKHINMPDEETIQLVEQRNDPCKHEIMKAMEATEDLLQDNSMMQPDMIELMDKQPRNRESQEYNKWTVDVMKTALLKVDDYDVSRDISSCAKYLNTYNSALEVNKLLLSRDVIKYLAEKHRLEGENKSKLTEMERTLYVNLQAVQKTMNIKGKNTENPNVRILSDTLRKMLNEKGDESRAMVFVKARATCRSLAAFLDKDLEQSGVRASPLFGKESRGGDDGMTESQQTEILEKFREGFFKVLVCTSVGNEGIDIPDCNIVLSYEYSGDEITKIQMKGRARKKAATTITMGSDKVVEQERINAYKASMMYRALNRAQAIDPKYFDMKVTAFQKEETHKYRFKAEVEKLKKGRKSDEDYEILCGRCNSFACYVSDVRQLGHDHIVIDKSFAEKITRKEHKKPRTYDGLHKKYKMFCKKCPLDWGIIGIRDGLDCMILKIINFKFRNLRTRGVSTYKKWIDMPYNVPEIKLEDLPRLLGPEEE